MKTLQRSGTAQLLFVKTAVMWFTYKQYWRNSRQSTTPMQPTFADLELLAEVSTLLNHTEVDAVLSRVIELCARAVGASRVSMFLHADGEVDWNHVFTARNLAGNETIKVVTKVLDEGFAGWVKRHRRGDIIADTTQDERWIVLPNDPIPARSAMCVPFMDEDNVVAVITFVHESPNHFTPYHLRLMTIVANLATISIRNAQLFSIQSQQRRQFQTILQSIRDVLIVLNQRGEIVLANEAALPLLRKETVADVLHTPLSAYAAVDDVFAPILDVLQQASQSNTGEWSFETRSRLRKLDFQVTMSHWLEPMRGEVGFVVVMHNITELKDLARFKDEMLRVATHDLRSPLALITGYADMILMDTPDKNSPVVEYVDIIRRSVDRMGVLIDDLLRVERVRSSPLELQARIDPEALVRQVIVNTRLLAEAKHHTFVSELRLDEAPYIMVDTVLLRQAMENLVGNAIKYTPAGGRITIRAWYDADRFYFQVSDTGIGIAPEHQARVFESFYRVQGPHQQEKGSGLGLSLVKNVIMRHQGDVWLKSRLGAGSEFGFWIPLAQAAAETASTFR
jgi:signal transduction histidine kinase